MLLQTNSYIVPKEKRAAHNHLMQRFRQVLQKVGCDHFEVYEQVGTNWNGIDAGGRFVQLMKFRDRKHCQAVQLVERQDPAAQALVREFCDLINFPYQEQQGLFAHGYYQAIIDPIRTKPGDLAFHNFETDATKSDTARRIAAGLPDTPHSIDDAPDTGLPGDFKSEAATESSVTGSLAEPLDFDAGSAAELEGDEPAFDEPDFGEDPFPPDPDRPIEPKV